MYLIIAESLWFQVMLLLDCMFISRPENDLSICQLVRHSSLFSSIFWNRYRYHKKMEKFRNRNVRGRGSTSNSVGRPPASLSLSIPEHSCVDRLAYCAQAVSVCCVQLFQISSIQRPDSQSSCWPLCSLCRGRWLSTWQCQCHNKAN